MNVTLADAEEVWLKKDHKRVELGRILLKGDNIVSCVQTNTRRIVAKLTTNLVAHCRSPYRHSSNQQSESTKRPDLLT